MLGGPITLNDYPEAGTIITIADWLLSQEQVAEQLAYIFDTRKRKFTFFRQKSG